MQLQSIRSDERVEERYKIVERKVLNFLSENYARDTSFNVRKQVTDRLVGIGINILCVRTTETETVQKKKKVD